MLKTFCLAALLPLAACSSTLTGAEIDVALQQSLRSARGHHEAGRDTEAARLLMAITQVDPKYPGLSELDDQVPTLLTLEHPGALGSNRRPREHVDSGVLARVAWYLPDRILDVLDVFSFDVHIGVGALVNVHLTRAVQAGVGARTVGGIGWHDMRSLGVRAQAEAGFNVIAAGAQAVSAYQAGTSGVTGGSWDLAGLHGPLDTIYRDDRDYWAIGAQVTAAIVGVDVDVHPVELFDAVVGFLLFDPAHDDFATTKGLELSDTDERFLRDIEHAAGSEKLLHQYELHKGYDSEPSKSADPAESDEPVEDVSPAESDADA